MKSSTKCDVALNQQMEELQLRMQMLSKENIIIVYLITLWQHNSFYQLFYELPGSDRKVNIDVIEASKTANLEEISRLREGNKEYRQKLTILQKVGVHLCYFLSDIFVV